MPPRKAPPLSDGEPPEAVVPSDLVPLLVHDRSLLGSEAVPTEEPLSVKLIVFPLTPVPADVRVAIRSTVPPKAPVASPTAKLVAAWALTVSVCAIAEPSPAPPGGVAVMMGFPAALFL